MMNQLSFTVNFHRQTQYLGMGLIHCNSCLDQQKKAKGWTSIKYIECISVDEYSSVMNHLMINQTLKSKFNIMLIRLNQNYNIRK